jgi:hypothetical protein
MVKVLKVLKVLNFSGTGRSNIFRLTFTSAAEPDRRCLPAVFQLGALAAGDSSGGGGMIQR